VRHGAPCTTPTHPRLCPTSPTCLNSQRAAQKIGDRKCEGPRLLPALLPVSSRLACWKASYDDFSSHRQPRRPRCAGAKP
jgi:hypothetical protein